MPIYEYVCTECEHAYEALQKMSDDPLQECPSCGKPALKKLVSAAGFRLSGSGWYETDFKSDKQKNLVDSGNKSKASAAKDSDSGKKGKSTTKEAAA
ncbi:MAG: FmdB family zinc ribbon protein [Gammaproteobacteria bacterium]